MCSVEDTDQARSTPESEAAVIEDLKWIGIKWDEGAIHYMHIADCQWGCSSPVALSSACTQLVGHGAWLAGPNVGGPHGPYRQSERKELYQQYVNQLVDDGLVYPCFCTDEELAEMKADAEKKNLPPIYRLKTHASPVVLALQFNFSCLVGLQTIVAIVIAKPVITVLGCQ